VFLLGGSALGAALAGSVVEASGPRTAFLLGALPPALAAVVLGLAVTRRPVRPRAANPPAVDRAA